MVPVPTLLGIGLSYSMSNTFSAPLLSPAFAVPKTPNSKASNVPPTRVTVGSCEIPRILWISTRIVKVYEVGHADSLCSRSPPFAPFVLRSLLQHFRKSLFRPFFFFLFFLLVPFISLIWQASRNVDSLFPLPSPVPFLHTGALAAASPLSRMVASLFPRSCCQFTSGVVGTNEDT